ncbi:MAG: SMP-30/gluconolactonase/LRE family protein [Rubrivivax sp.]|nr:SMP-30/gluconolactonase/LRE family protein [Rubrivivax sp.]
MTGGAAVTALPVPPALLGESPLWHPDEAALYWCDIPGRALHRWTPAGARHSTWALESEPGCIAPLPGGELLVAMRDGLWRFDPASGRRHRLAPAPYDAKVERFNDGKADARGRFWVGTIYEPRTAPHAALYRWSAGRLQRMAGDVTVSNGLAFSPDGRTMYWSDTTSHRIYALDFDGSDGTLSRQRVLAEFPLKAPGQDLAGYGGRPDGAAVDVEGAYWVAMYEGQRLLRLSPAGEVLREVPLPVRCPTMPCFGGADLRTLFITTARHQRPAAELAAQPLAGCVLTMAVDVPGLPVNFACG